MTAAQKMTSPAPDKAGDRRYEASYRSSRSIWVLTAIVVAPRNLRQPRRLSYCNHAEVHLTPAFPALKLPKRALSTLLQTAQRRVSQWTSTGGQVGGLYI